MILLFSVLALGIKGQEAHQSFPHDSAVLDLRGLVFITQNCTDCELQISETPDFDAPVIVINEIDQDTLWLSEPLATGEFFWRIRNTGEDWRVKRFELIDLLSFPSLTQWLVADSAQGEIGEEVPLWEDISGNGNSVQQAMVTKQPKIAASGLNDKRSLRFDGDDILNGGDILDIQDNPISIYLVLQSEEVTYTVLGKGRGVNDNLAYSVFPANNSFRIVAKDGGLTNASNPTALVPEQFLFANVMIDREGDFARVDVNTDQGPEVGLSGFDSAIDSDFDYLIGAYTEAGQFPFVGEILEVLFFEDILDNEQDSLVEMYLTTKYSPPVDLGADKTLVDLCSTVLRVEGEQYLEVLWSDASSLDSLVVSAPGEYWVQTTDILGRVSSDTIQVILPGNLLSGQTVLCVDSTLTWDTGLDSDQYSFIWQDASNESFFEISEGGEFYVELSYFGGCTLESDTLEVLIADPQSTIGLGPDQDLCSGNSIGFLTGADEVESALWNESIPGLELVVEMSGSYTVEFFDFNGCPAADTIEITIIGEAPIASFEFENTCLGQATNFTDSSIPQGGSIIDDVQWEFGDGESGTGFMLDYEYALADTFSVEMTVFTDVGCQSVLTQDVIITPYPQAAMDFQVPCSDKLTLFYDMSTVEQGGVVQREWLFDGQGFAMGEEAAYIFEEVGAYSVELIVTTEAGCADTLEQQVFVNGSPISSFSADAVCLGEPMLFNADPDISESGPILTYRWDFEGTVSIFESTTYTWLTPGPHDVILDVTSVLGCSDDTLITVTVSDDPIGDFLDDASCFGEPIQFQDNTVPLFGDEIVQWDWFFGSEGGSNQENPLFEFSSPGTYTVALNIVSAAGCEDQVDRLITIFPLPTSSFTIDPLIGQAPFTPEILNFSEESTEYLWTLDQGLVSSEFEPIHTFLDTGLVTVDLLVTNEFGCTDVSSGTILLTELKTDLVLLEVDYGIQGEFLSPDIIVRNLSNYRVESFTIEAEVAEGTLLRELYDIPLMPDEIREIDMSSSLLFRTGTDLPYLCISVFPSEDKVEVTPEDNIICVSIGSPSDEVYWLDPVPNPVSDILMFGVVNAPSSSLSAKMYDAQGRMTLSMTYSVGNSFVEDLELDVATLPPGRYILKLTLGLEEQVHRIQVLRD